MKLTKLSFLFSVIVGLLLTVSTFAQSETFSDRNVEYTFDLPEANWKMTVKPSATIPNVEYVYGDRSNGHLEIRKLEVKSNQLLSDIIRDEEQKLQFLPGFVAGKEEDFKGSLGGKVFNYEFVRSGRNMSGRFYFLKADDATVYVLRFNGLKDKLRSARNQTDSIARTFNLKKSKNGK
ncbi:MAG: hypothetical protein ACR2MG_01075 [Pyrinomonadaceae bacterium]